MPNVPQDPFPQKMTAKACMTAKHDGMVWSYLGGREMAMPPHGRFSVTRPRLI